MKTRVITAFLSLAILASGCADKVADVTPETTVETDTDIRDQATNEKADQWGSADDPALFSAGLEYKLSALPMDGESANIPWASSYWPVYQDSINYRWEGDGTLAPSEKYGEAFGVENIADKISKHHGIEKYSSRTACKTTDDCDSDKVEQCAKRHGEEEGYCIPSWWGICHAWAPAAIMHAEPLRPVTRNGVEFKINDIKALVTMMHNRTSSKFVSLRCNETDSLDEIEYDEYDRPTGSDEECKDTNPGTYHVLLANYLGLKGESFVEDRTFDSEVWNQPIRAYRITKQEEVTAQKANALVGVQPTGDNAPTIFEGAVAKDAWRHFEAVTVTAGQTVKITMTGTNDADIYVKLGAQPSLNSYDCRPWVDGSTEVCEVAVPEGQTQLFVSVNGYSSDESSFKVTVLLDELAGIATDYKFNDKAAKFFYVKSEVDYIAESPSDRDGNLGGEIDTYTHTDHYEYILEVDSDGKIIGGEWLGASKKAHPDFLWLPTGRRDFPAVAGGAMKWSDVKSLLDESLADPNSTTETVTKKETGNVAKGAWAHFGPFNTSTGAVNVVLSGTGDGDLYVKKGAQPTASSYDCRPYKWGTAEDCSLQGPGEVFVSVFGYEASDFEVSVTYTTDSGEPTDPVDPVDPVDPEEPAHLNETGTVAQGQMKFFSIQVIGGKRIVVRTTGTSADIDLYTKMNLTPTTSNYDKRAYTYSGNETIDFTPTASGIMHIAVHGYEASDFVLTTADE